MRRYRALICLGLLAGGCARAADGPTAWDFEAETVDWLPRAATVRVERVAGQGATQDSRAWLRVVGSMPDGWNYAIGPRAPMTAGQTYRLTAWVKVVRLGERTPPPFLKCEFVAATPIQVGRVNTDSYNWKKQGEWQRLTAEFEAPAGTVACWIALEKGTSEPCEVEALIDDVKVEPIEELSALTSCRLDPLPAPLARLRGVHPRLFLDAERVKRLREAIQTTHAEMWREVQAVADRAAKNGPPAYYKHDKYSGDEQLWQREVGNAMPYLALAWLLTDDRKYLDGAAAWATASCGYETWGLGAIDGMDLAAGHQLLGLATIYDWCHDALPEDVRTTIRATFERRAGTMFRRAAMGQAWWSRSYLQNHLWVNACGLGAAGLAVYDELDGADAWAGLALQKLRRSLDSLGPDGASHEGVGYWSYGVEYLLKFMDLAESLLAVECHDNDWFRNTADYRIYLTIPGRGWTNRQTVVDFADCPRGEWYGPDYLLRRLAARYRQPHAQWLAAELDAANISGMAASWLNLLWYDPDLAPAGPETQPTLKHFPDLGIVSARSDWSGDESLVAFKCGPYLGARAMDAFDYDPGGGHVHPDTGHFVLFGSGEWLIRDDGYAAKWTNQHNTLLIDGLGQLGEGRMWFDGGPLLKAGAKPRIVEATAGAQVDRIVGDATVVYPPELGLQRFVRTLLFVKPNALLVIDDIATDRPRDLELRLHPEHAATADGPACVATGERSRLRVELLTADGVSQESADLPMADRHGGTGPTMPTIRFTRHAATWHNVVALTWSTLDGQPERVTMATEGGRTVFYLAGKRVPQ